MIAVKRDCLPPETLRNVLQGTVSREQFDSAISHLDHCESCRKAAESLDDELSRGRISEWFRGDSSSRSMQNETACQVALQSVMQRSFESRPPSVTHAPPFESLGPYRLLAWVGSGGMGAVYRAEHQRLKRQCAIKLLPPEKTSQAGWLERFDREMTTIASLQHPNIVSATDAGHEDGWHYLVMEFLDGLDVGRIASRMSQLSTADACEIVRQAALGLQHIHDSGLVHRDIKPSNLMLTRAGTVKLLDLGLVLQGDDPLSMDDRLTTVGHVMGTMPYMAPEQLADSREVHPQSDLYSLGATLYRLLVGHPPHPGGRGLAAHVLSITHDDAKPLDSQREDIDKDVVQLVHRMLSRDLKQRPQSALEVAEALEPACKGNRLKSLLRDALRRDDPDAPPASRLLPTLPSRADQPRRRRTTGVLIGLAAAAVLFAVGMLIKIQTDRGDLVIHSEHDGISLLIKQGDEVIDRLTVTAGEDNRKILHKGTYRVEIQGGGQALKLSDEVVTIGRGDEQAIQVLEDAAKQPSANPASANPAPADTQALAGSQNAPPKDPLQAYLSQLNHDGKTLRQWLDLLEQSSDIETIGEAMFSIARTVQNVHTPTDQGDVCRTAFRAMFQRAREFGGLTSKIPPLPGTTSTDVTPSEQFMWYLQQVFGNSKQLAIWYEVAAEELIEGNTESRSAAISALYRYNARHNQGRSGLGGMGGLSGQQLGMESFDTIKLLRCCVGLGAPESWTGLPPQQQSKAARMARETAILITENQGSSIFAYPDLCEILKDTPRSEMGETEKDYFPDPTPPTAPAKDQEPATDQNDSSSESTSSKSETPGAQPAAPKSNPDMTETSGAIYQGRDLNDWMESLKREREIKTLGEAMTAVELLSQDASTEDRMRAAEETLKLARKYGGVAYSTINAGDSSQAFMSVFMEVFPAYFPQPGLELTVSELATDHAQSKQAILWALERFCGSSQSITYIASIADDSSAKPKLTTIIETLLDHVENVPADASQSETIAAKMATNAALWMAIRSGQPIPDNDRLRQYVIERVNQRREEYDLMDSGQPMFNTASPLSEPELAAAVQIAMQSSEFGTQPTWNALVKDFWSPLHRRQSNDLKTVWSAITEHAPESVQVTIQQKLSQPASLLTTYHNAPELLRQTVPWYAEHADPDLAIAQLENLEKHARSLQAALPADVRDAIEKALETASARKAETPSLEPSSEQPSSEQANSAAKRSDGQ